jgi:hypothetical protein
VERARPPTPPVAFATQLLGQLRSVEIQASLLPGAKLMFSSLWSTAWSKAKPAGVGGGL